jgi:catechol 2,3-dioxygenase-like lactoylglutathione lyase family enzyme
VHPFSPLLRFRELVVTAGDPHAAVDAWQQLFDTPSTEDAVWLGDVWLRCAQGDRGDPTHAIVEVVDPDAVAAAAMRRGLQPTMTGGAPVLTVSGVPVTLVPEGEAVGARPTAGGVRRVHHVVVAVGDEPSALARWRTAFDFRPAPEGPEGLLAPHHVPVGDAWFGVTSRGTDAEAVGRFVARRGEGVYAIALVVDDRAQAIARVADAGGQVLGGADDPQVFVHPRNTHGVLVELLEEWAGGVRRPA